MTTDVLQQVLAEASTKHEDGRFEFEPELSALMLAVGHATVSIDRVRQIELKGAYLVATTSRGERLLAGVDTVVLLRVGRGAEKEPGFVAR